MDHIRLRDRGTSQLREACPESELAWNPAFLRESTAVAQILHGIGANVTVFDPASLTKAQRACQELRYAESVAEAARDTQVVLLLTDWPESVQLSPDGLSAVVAKRNIVDGRNALDAARWRRAGWEYRAPWRRHRGAILVVLRRQRVSIRR